MKTKIVLPAAILLFAGIAASANPAPKIEPIPLASGAFFALSVPDAKASANWYREKLGLQVILQPPRSGPAEVVILQGGGLIVELIQHDDALALARLNPPVAGSHLVQGFFKAGAFVEDFDATIALLIQRRVKIAYGPFRASGNIPANLIISDNAGNLIQFFGK